MIATQQIGGNNSGPFLRKPKIVVMHSTRSTIATKTDAEELQSTLNWFVNPNGASSHWVLSELERVRVVSDALIAWHSTYLNGRSWGIEMTQPTIDRPFTDGHYANAALIGKHYVSLGVAPVWLGYWDGGEASGFVAHEDTKQGRESGKSDPGPKFDTARFISSLNSEPIEEDDMKLIIIKTHSSNTQWVTDGMTRWPYTSAPIKTEFEALGLTESGVEIVTDALMAAIPTVPAKASGGGGGIGAAEARLIAQEEDDKLRVTK
jgi:N-acetyl-anhydromuramyl-L-alanine amidase AmpD